MSRLICLLFGHRWRPYGYTSDLKHGAPFVRCSRCEKTGWLL